MKRWHKSTVARSLMFSFLIVLFSISFINLTIHYWNMQLLENEIEDAYQTDLKYLSDQLDQNLSNLELLCASLSINPNIISLNYGGGTAQQLLLQYRSLLEQLSFYSQNTVLEADITVFLKNKQVSLSSKGGKRTIDPQALSARTAAAESNSFSPVWVIANESGGVGYILSYIMETSALSTSGIAVMVQLGGPQIKDFLSSLEKQGESLIFIADSTGELLFPETLTLDTTALKEELTNAGQSGKFSTSLGKTKYRAMYHQLGHANLYTVLYYPETLTNKPLSDMMWFMIAALIASVVLGIFFVSYAYRNLLIPIHELVGVMKLVANGDLTVRAKDNKREEFNFLSGQFNAMIEKIDVLIIDVYAEKIEKQETQLKFLQSQINPHFLYNCMNFIYQTSVGENNEASAKMSLYLGKYFRFITNSHLDTVKLADELESIEAYIEIQKMRFNGRFNCHISVDSQLNDAVIPRLIIQPLIENSFVHGLKTRSDTGNIWLTITAENGLILISVEDDGAGVSQERLLEINASFQDSSGCDSYDSIGQGGGSLLGLRNTRHRLKLFYGERAGIVISRRKPAGTSSKITIPLDGERSVRDVQPSDC